MLMTMAPDGTGADRGRSCCVAMPDSYSGGVEHGQKRTGLGAQPARITSRKAVDNPPTYPIMRTGIHAHPESAHPNPFRGRHPPYVRRSGFPAGLRPGEPGGDCGGWRICRKIAGVSTRSSDLSIPATDPGDALHVASGTWSMRGSRNGGPRRSTSGSCATQASWTRSRSAARSCSSIRAGSHRRYSLRASVRISRSRRSTRSAVPCGSWALFRWPARMSSRSWLA